MQTSIFSLPYPRLLPLAAALAFFAVSPAFAQEEPSTMQKLLGAAGLLELPKAPIDYEERPPLVVPPSSNLPAPVDAADVRKLNPEWPVDHDVKRGLAQKRGPKIVDVPNDAFYGENTLRPDQMRRRAGGTQSKQASTPGPYDMNSAGVEAYLGNERYTPSQLGFHGWGKKDSTIVFRGEPERTSLLQPPSGYFRPSPDAPFGIVEDEKKTFNINKHYDRNDDRNDRF